MALEEMLDALGQEGKDDIKRVDSQAKAHENQIIEEARLEAKQIYESHKNAIEEQVKMERARVINQTNFKVKKEVVKTKEEIMNQVFDEALKQIKNLRDDKASYESIFGKLAAETIRSIPGKPVVSVDSADEELARKVFDRLELDCTLKSDINCLGGLSVRSEDGKIVLNNTVDSRIEKAKQLLKTDVIRVLFGDN